MPATNANVFPIHRLFRTPVGWGSFEAAYRAGLDRAERARTCPR
jgi:hypothetical protein